MRRLLLMVTLAGIVTVAPAWAQTSSDQPAARPATATYWGDTGLWFVPTAEVVRPKGWSFSLYRTEFDFTQGATDVSDWPVTIAAGAGPRTEIFGALRAITRIDRDTRPLFQAGNRVDGGLINDRPFVRETWTGNQIGDLFLGVKVNLLSEHRQQPLALALRGTVKVPTADSDHGTGTGEYDYFADMVFSKEVHRRVELTGFGGYAFRGDPDDVSLSNGLRWGLGAAFGARSSMRLTTEVFGERTANDAVNAKPLAVVGTDGSTSPTVSLMDQGVTSALGLTWQHASGVSLGAGVTYQFGLGADAAEGSSIRSDSRGWGLQFRLGFHRGVRVSVPSPAPRIVEAPPAAAPVAAPSAPAAAPVAMPAPNRRPTVRAQCTPCRLEVGRAAKIIAESQDPDGDTLSYRWSAAAGTIADTRALSTMWTAETVPGPVVLTITADDGRGGVATDTVNIEVVRAALLNVAFDDVRFDLDQSTLRADAQATLDRAIQTLRDSPAMTLHIEGHASEEGTAEYNLALGERRALAVRDYLVNGGVDASRLSTVSFGETRPIYDNSREGTRRLNRRAALVVDPAGDER